MTNSEARDTAPSLELIDKAIEQFDPIAVFGLFSGGHDSLTACHVASRHPKFTGCVHINTGIGIPQTQEFVRETCKREGWNLREIRAKEDCGQDFEELVVERGFPGPPHHYKMYNRLKERALKLLTKETKVGHSVRSKILLISGCRSQESTRRMGHVEPIQHRKEDGARVWVAVIHDWSKDDCNNYIAAHKLPRNQVVDLIHKSGECLCGSFAIPPKDGEVRGEEFRELAMWYPEVAANIERIEARVREAGFPWNWDERQPKWFRREQQGQEAMFDLAPHPPEPMCWSCNKRNDDVTDAAPTGESEGTDDAPQD